MRISRICSFSGLTLAFCWINFSPTFIAAQWPFPPLPLPCPPLPPSSPSSLPCPPFFFSSLSSTSYFCPFIHQSSTSHPPTIFLSTTNLPPLFYTCPYSSLLCPLSALFSNICWSAPLADGSLLPRAKSSSRGSQKDPKSLKCTNTHTHTDRMVIGGCLPPTVSEKSTQFQPLIADTHLRGCIICQLNVL